jgi:nickel transport protein
MKSHLLAAALAIGLTGAAAAHELHHQVVAQNAVAVRLAYPDGKPFAYETYELYPKGSEAPAQVGKTDAEGRVVFIPGTRTEWRLRAFSADGHGADVQFDSPELTSAPQSESPLDRTARVLFGLSAILAAFAAYQFLIRRKEHK